MANATFPAQPADSYLTLAGIGEHELRVRRSRFIARARPAADEAQAREAIRAMAAEYHDARHVCHAWRLGLPPSLQEQRSDAKEPAGTAGEPILQAIRARDLTAALVVVVRYFGGIKLGPAGLARAYGEAAAGAVAAAGTKEVLLGREFAVRLPYAWRKTLGHLLGQHRGRILAESYGPQVECVVWLPHSTWQAFAQALAAASAGSLRLQPRDG